MHWADHPLTGGTAYRADHVGERGDDPQRHPCAVVGEPAGDDEQGSDRRKRAEVDERLACRRIAPRLGALHGKHQQLHRHIGNAEPAARFVKRMRDRDGHGQGCRNRAQHQNAGAGASLKIDRRPCPRELRPLPPHQPRDQHAACRTCDGQVVADERGDLGDGEDEDEIEEQLEVGGVSLRLVAHLRRYR
jgi:hypothetical protein